MDNPFAFLRKDMLGDNFIGRGAVVANLCDKVKLGDMTCIVGLPRMGKTTLVNHVFMEPGRPDYWFREQHMIPILICLSDYEDARDFWGAVAEEMSDALRNVKEMNDKKMDKTELNDVMQKLERVLTLSSAADRYTIVHNTHKKISEKLHVRFIYIIDEFDYIWKYKYSSQEFSHLRTLSSGGHVITCSRRPPQLIEKLAYKTSYFINKEPATIFITPFTVDDVELYWNHFCFAFKALGKTEYNDYKKLVSHYAGNHPDLMNMMNYFALKEGSLSEWCRQLNTPERYKQEWKFRASLVDAFNEQMRYVKEQELDKAVIRLVLEGIQRPPKEEIDQLLKYGFVRIVSLNEKRKIFGYDLGPTTDDNKHCYVCFSDLACHLLQDNYRPLLKGVELLEVTEKKLRTFVKSLLKKQYGEDCLNVVEGDEFTLNYQEKWEEAFPHPEFKTERDVEKEQERWEARKSSRYERVCNNCRPPEERPPIDTMSTFTLGDLIFTFFNNKRQWNDEAMNFRKIWKNDFAKMNKLRNATQHFYDEEKTTDFIEKAEASCRKICQYIDKWMSEK